MASGHLRPYERLFGDDYPAAISRTLEIAERCTFSLNEIRYRYPSEYLPDGTTSAEWLRHVTFEGAKERYPEEGLVNVVRQLEKELEIIETPRLSRLLSNDVGAREVLP